MKFLVFLISIVAISTVNSNEDPKLKIATLNKCLQPKEPGKCRAIIPRFYFNSETNKCDGFDYGGCGGNGNRFEDKAQCEKECASFMTKPAPKPAPKPEPKPDPKPVVQRVEPHIKNMTHNKCFQSKEPGMCRASIPRYHFNSDSNKCEEFSYGGCGGNGNNFESKELCEKECAGYAVQPLVKPVEPKIKVITQNVCLEEKKVGICRAAFKRFFYNSATGQCEQFIFGGCEANGNNFVLKGDCEKKCVAKTVPEQDKNKTQDAKPTKEDCLLEKKIGPCYAAIDRYFYNSTAKKCELFIFGGCQGNNNNFHKREECEKLCLNVKDESNREKEKDKIKDKAGENVHMCLQEKQTGTCRAFFNRFYFNSTTKQCTGFVYGGCDGNKNNFISMVACERECAQFLKDKPTAEVKPDKQDKIEKPAPAKCSLDKKVGTCRANIERFYYDAKAKKCDKFTYAGCDGNENNFRTMADCERECAGVKPTLPPKTTANPAVNPCTLPSDTGICKALMQRYFYNSNTKKCETFTYGGCKGNENNFRTIDDCKKKCVK